MRLSLIGMPAWLAALALAAPLAAQVPAGGPPPRPLPPADGVAAEPGASPTASPTGSPPASPVPEPPARRLTVPLTVTVARDGTIEVTGDAPAGFPLAELRSRTPGMRITADGDFHPRQTPEPMERLLDALTTVLPRLAEGEILVSEAGLAVEGTLRPGFSAEATRGALRLTLGSGWETRIDITEAPPPAALAVTWSRHGAVVSGILPAGLPPAEALPMLRRPLEGLVDGGLVDAGLTGGGHGDAASWRAALPLLGRLLPAFGHAVVRVTPGSLDVEGTLEPGHEAERLQSWLATELGEDWEVRITESVAAGASGNGTGPQPARPAAEGAVRRDPVTGRDQQLVSGRWIPVHAFPPDPAACGRRSSAILAAEPLTFAPGGTELEAGAAGTLDHLAGIARRCLNQGRLSLLIGGHTDSRGAAEENLALSEARAMKVLLELVARGVRADAMEAVGHGETRAIAGNDTEEGRARNRRITFAWSR